jgi:hypothetical protein
MPTLVFQDIHARQRSNTLTKEQKKFDSGDDANRIAIIAIPLPYSYYSNMSRMFVIAGQLSHAARSGGGATPLQAPCEGPFIHLRPDWQLI